MSTEEALLENERSALENNDFVSHVSGRGVDLKKKSSAGVIFALVVTVAIFAVFLASSSILPATIAERLIEETDVQYADAVESKMVVFQQALSSGDIPSDTAEKLLRGGVEVGYIKDGQFITANKSDKSLALRLNGKIIEAKDFVTEANANLALYEAFNNATYSRAAYYYDDAAREVFKQIGTSRNNYNSSSNFDAVTEKIIGEGSNINANTVALVEKTREENGETITYYEYEGVGDSTASKSSSFIADIAEKNRGANTNDATMNAASMLNIADTISKEQRSELLFVSFMENISKMKAGEGSNAKVNEVMNRLYETTETEVVDTNTGEIIKVSGSMLESPSMYAVLTGTQIKTEQVRNYSSDRILNLTENKLGRGGASDDTLHGAVTSTKSRISGSIGRFINNGSTIADTTVLDSSSQIINSSLVNNSYSTMGGISGGELLVEGAVNVGRALAKASGATSGSEEATKSYARLTSSVLALDAELDRKNRSPFDITSRNTFLGSIIYNLATTLRPGSLLTQFSNVGRVLGSSIAGLLPNSYADDEGERYLANFGNCETLNSIGAAGSATCSEIATFDTSTLDNVFNDSGFTSFVENNTYINESGTRVVKTDSALADFINYNNNRLTPTGVTDGGILKSLSGNSSSIPFISDILSLVKDFLGASESDKRMARGETFVNSSSNPDWDTYKYAQRYVSLARATESLRRYSNDQTAYTSLKYFEGAENPVIAFINSQNNIASK